MRKITEIVIHCSATPEGKYFDRDDIDAWHKARGWRGIGYHYVILLDGTVQKGRPDSEVGAHVEGHNAHSIGICYIGGVSANNIKVAKDTRTAAQKQAMGKLVASLMQRYPGARVLGHRDYPGVAKACPSFDAIPWWSAYKSGNAVLVPVQPPESMPPVNDVVLALQNALKKAGFDPHGLDGVWGPMTVAALNGWERTHSVATTLPNRPSDAYIRSRTNMISTQIAMANFTAPPKESWFVRLMRALGLVS